MDQSRENEFLLYLAVQSVRGSRVMTLPEGLDYASLFAKAGRAGVFRAVAGGIAPQLLPDEGRKTLDGIAAREARKQRDAAALLAALENGELPLEDSVRLYKEGLTLSRSCREQLEKARNEVRLLTEEGLEPFDEKKLDEEGE